MGALTLAKKASSEWEWTIGTRVHHTRSDTAANADANSDVPQGQTKSLDERQITHLICARLKYDLYDFLGGVLGPFIQEKEQEAGPKTPPKKII